MRQNKVTYEEAVLMLKEKKYQAPNKWEKLENELTLNDNLSSLKKYKAPEYLWKKIEMDLEVEMPQKKYLSNKKVAIGVITILMLIYAASQLFKRESVENTFVYKSEIEIIESKLPEIKNNSMAYRAGSDYIKGNEEMFPEESYSDYQSELKDLDTAIAKIKKMQEEYGEDASSLKMLSKLERQKADLIKSMINRV